MTGSVDRLLLLQPRWLGDVLLCTPAIREARRAFPDARIDFATEPAGGEALRNNPYLDEVLVDRKSARSRLALLGRVARGRYDAVVDFRSTGSTAQLTAVSRARIRIGIRGRGPRNLAYSHLVDRLSLDTYAARHKLDMLQPLGVNTRAVTDLSLDLPIGEAARLRAARVWQENGLDGERVVALSPVSREPYKQWGIDRWAEVADRIAEQGARILLTHGPGEADQAESVASRMRHPSVWRYGSTTIEEAGALLERCVLWAGNDGGSKHIAAAAGLPTVAVTRWGIGRVWTDRAAERPQVYVEREPSGACGPECVGCDHEGSLDSVRIEDVVPAVIRALDMAAR